MSKRALLILASASALIALLSILLFDRAIANAVRSSGVESASFVVYLRDHLDVLTGRGLVGANVGLGQFLLGGVFIVFGLAWLLVRRGSMAGRGLMFAGAVQWATIEAGWLLKDLFGRMRPFQLLEKNDWSHIWFAGGNSFPSGHNAFFWGICLPLAYVFPKWRIPLLIVPLFIALARIDENYHFLSDVLASICLAALITLLAAMLFGRWVKPSAGAMR